MDTVTGFVKYERIDDRPQEFPRINESCIGLRNRYGYSAGIEEIIFWKKFIVKLYFTTFI
ncbi:hypothetical protein [Marivivens sp.]|uniref:hypothetical protein n=1 Tax=Marivivens sp. TaxID=1978374 RepID=UPI00345C1595